MANLIVTGGAGFIGCRFVKHWLDTHPTDHVTVLDALTYAGSPDNLIDCDPKRTTLVQGSITDQSLVEKLFKELKPAHIAHFAAESHVDRSIEGPAAFVETNVKGTFTLLEAARKVLGKEGYRFLHVSTDEVYGSLSLTDPAFTEETPYDPRSPYSASKAASDHFASAYVHTFGLPVVISNCSNNYGPYQYPEKLIPVVILSCLNRCTIPVYGKGDNVRDWLYVDDHAEALALILQKGRIGEKYNIGGDAETSNIDVVKTICSRVREETDRSFDFTSLIKFVTDRPGHDFRYAMDHTKLTRELGWKPRMTFEKGMTLTVKWYLEHREWLNRRISSEYRERFKKHYGFEIKI